MFVVFLENPRTLSAHFFVRLFCYILKQDFIIGFFQVGCRKLNVLACFMVMQIKTQEFSYHLYSYMFHNCFIFLFRV